MAAVTTLAPVYPGYVNLSREADGTVVVTVRGDPKSRSGVFVCAYPRDRGQPGRCTPGDEHCNNYCAAAPEKGEVQISPKDCVHTDEGETVSVRLTPAEWKTMLSEILEGVNV